MDSITILWILLPIFGWFAILGYQVRLVREWVSGKFEELPLFSFAEDMKLGFFIFLKLIPLMLAIGVAEWLLARNILGSLVFALITIFMVPILMINLFVKNTVVAGFEIEQVNMVFDNIVEYLIAVLKEIGLGIIFAIMSIILVGIPASAFTQNIFLADFYGRNVK